MLWMSFVCYGRLLYVVKECFKDLMVFLKTSQQSDELLNWVNNTKPL